jgi:hypothetical protein
MAINQNHLFEELDGVKCAVVEKNVSPDRVNFLKPLLEFNGFRVMVVESPPPKTPVPTADSPDQPAVTPPVTFTLGVTDVTFNATNAIFGRLLHTPEGHVVTRAYWLQEVKESNDRLPYFAK